MERFQIDFWKHRQSEVEAYTMQYKPLTFKAGDLGDPMYFDFISVRGWGRSDAGG